MPVTFTLALLLALLGLALITAYLIRRVRVAEAERDELLASWLAAVGRPTWRR